MQFFTLGSFVFFTGLVGLITWVLTRRDRHDTSDGYFLAGRTLTAGFIAGSLLLTNLSTEQLVGLNGAAFSDGLCVMAWEVIAGASLVVMALLFLPRYLKSGIATIPQFLENRFDSTTRSITSIIFIVAYAGILLPIILYTGATGLMGILDVPALTGLESEPANLWLTVWVIGIIGSIYAIFGGLRTVAVSDTINGFGLLVGGVLITWLGLSQINSNPIAALDTLRDAHPEKFNSLGRPTQSVPFSTLFTGVLLLNLFYWCTNQQIIQRTFAAPSLREGQKGVLLAGGFKVLAPLILVLPGIIAFHLFGRVSLSEEKVPIKDITTESIALIGRVGGKEVILHGADAENVLGGSSVEDARKLEQTTVPYQDSRMKVEAVLGAGVVIVEDGNGKNQYHTDLDTNQLVSARRRDQAYGMLVRKVLPDWLAGFFAAVMVGAILSSFNSALNSTATLFSLGVYKQMMHPDYPERKVIHAGKTFGCIIAISSMTVAPLLAGQTSIFGYLQKMNGLYFIPIFAVVLVGLLWRRVPAVAANVALVVGFSAIALGYFVPAFSSWVDEIHEFHFLGIVFASLIALMLIIALVKPRPTPWEQQYTGEVDLTPWRWAWPVGLGLVLFVLTIYIAFADPSVLSFQ